MYFFQWASKTCKMLCNIETCILLEFFEKTFFRVMRDCVMRLHTLQDLVIFSMKPIFVSLLCNKAGYETSPIAFLSLRLCPEP